MISTHVPREGDDFDKIRYGFLGYISTHVPREGDDIWQGYIDIAP